VPRACTEQQDYVVQSLAMVCLLSRSSAVNLKDHELFFGLLSLLKHSPTNSGWQAQSTDGPLHKFS
jgi:hypothetical protein